MGTASTERNKIHVPAGSVHGARCHRPSNLAFIWVAFPLGDGRGNTTNGGAGKLGTPFDRHDLDMPHLHEGPGLGFFSSLCQNQERSASLLGFAYMIQSGCACTCTAGCYGYVGVASRPAPPM